jgi:hypothetical protein
VIRTFLIAIFGAATLIDGSVSMTGRVVADVTGEAIANARVSVVAAGQHASFVVTDGEGRFTITSPAIPYTVSAVKSGYLRHEVMVRDVKPSLELRLARAAVISGRVVDRLGDAIVDARVAAESPTQTKGTPTTVAATSTDDAGEFRLAGLAAGSFVVSVMTNSRSGQLQVGALPNGLAVRYDSQPTKTYYPEAATVAAAEIIPLAAGEERANVDIVVPEAQIGGGGFTMAGVNPSDVMKASPPDARGAIAGRVAAPDGKPLARAVVRLLFAGAPFPVQSTESNADGRYAFGGLATGTYRVAVFKPGYAPLKPSDLVFANLPMLGAGPFIDLNDNQKREDVDITLGRLGSVSGLVSDELGDPILGATVQLLRVRFERGRRRLVPAGSGRRTDDRGHYRIFDVASGQYLVVASVGPIMAFGAGAVDLPGYAPTYFPGSPDPSGARFIEVETSQEMMGIDFSLAPVRTALISGTILNAAGEPTTAGALQLRPAVAGGVMPVPMNARGRDDGFFEFPNVPPGSYVIYADRGRNNPSTEGEFATLPVTVIGDDVTGLTLQMSSGSSLSGQITFDTADPDHVPDASRIEISPIAVDVDASPGTVANADIVRDWTFQMRGINGVRRLLAPRLPPGWALREVRVNGVDATDRPMVFGRRDQSLSDIEVVLTDRVAVIAGTVTDADGRPTPGALVLAFAVDRDQRYPWSRFVQRTTSATDGTFTLAGVPGGSYYIAATTQLPVEGDDAWQDLTLQESLVPTASMLTVSEGEKRTIALHVSAR